MSALDSLLAAAPDSGLLHGFDYTVLPSSSAVVDRKQQKVAYQTSAIRHLLQQAHEHVEVTLEVMASVPLNLYASSSSLTIWTAPKSSDSKGVLGVLGERSVCSHRALRLSDLTSMDDTTSSTASSCYRFRISGVKLQSAVSTALGTQELLSFSLSWVGLNSQSALL